MLKSMHHVNIVVTNLQEAKKFFFLLGFEERASDELSGEWLSQFVGLPDARAVYSGLILPGSDTSIELLQYITPPSDRNPQLGVANQIGIRHLAFQVDDIEQEVRKLKENGVELLGGQPTGKFNRKFIYFYGPDGILLELVQFES